MDPGADAGPGPLPGDPMLDQAPYLSPRYLGYLGCLGTLLAKSVVYAKAHKTRFLGREVLKGQGRPARADKRLGSDLRAQCTRCCSLRRDARRVVGEPKTSDR